MASYQLECLQTLEGHTDRVWCLAWSPDGKYGPCMSVCRILFLIDHDSVMSPQEPPLPAAAVTKSFVYGSRARYQAKAGVARCCLRTPTPNLSDAAVGRQEALTLLLPALTAQYQYGPCSRASGKRCAAVALQLVLPMPAFLALFLLTPSLSTSHSCMHRPARCPQLDVSFPSKISS